jgi:iron complex outermembrane recepter protein
MRSLSYAFLTSASFAALAVAAPANAQTPAPVIPGGDPCQAPADQRDPNVTCPPADSPAGEAVSQGAQVTPEDQGVVVVGSRIRRDRFNTADPVTIINRDAAVDAGFNSTAEVLQSVGVTGGTGQIGDTFGGLVVEGGGGVNTIGLRGLGPTRTLVLLNGRRLAPAGTRGQVGAADLNVLPNSILDRIEVLNTGASSVYGSDAVAGVINIVTLSKFNGLAVEASVQAPEIGAGTTQRYSITAGTSGERFSILGSIEMYDRNRITQGDQPWARCPRQLYRNGPGTSRGDGDFIDPLTGESKCFPLEEGGVTVNTIGLGTAVVPATVFRAGTDLTPPIGGTPQLRCNRWAPNPSQTTGPFPGLECVTPLFFYTGLGTASGDLNYRDTFAPSMLQQDVISPARNYTGFLTATYDTDFFGDGQLYGELLVTRRKSQQNGQRQFTLDYPTNSPLITAGGVFATVPAGAPVAGASVRTFADYGIYDSRQTQDFVKLSGGFRGDLPFLSSWRYDAYAAKSWRTVSTSSSRSSRTVSRRALR